MAWKSKLNYKGVFTKEVDEYLIRYGFVDGTMNSISADQRNTKALVLTIQRFDHTNNTVTIHLSNQELVFQRFDKHMTQIQFKQMYLIEYFRKPFQELQPDDIDQLLNHILL